MEKKKRVYKGVEAEVNTCLWCKSEYIHYTPREVMFKNREILRLKYRYSPSRDYCCEICKEEHKNSDVYEQTKKINIQRGHCLICGKNIKKEFEARGEPEPSKMVKYCSDACRKIKDRTFTYRESQCAIFRLKKAFKERKENEDREIREMIIQEMSHIDGEKNYRHLARELNQKNNKYVENRYREMILILVNDGKFGFLRGKIWNK